jgi:hypothetical protein
MLVFTAVVAFAAAAHGQGVLDKTTLGARQNDERDLANSLVPGEKKYGGRGEKKAQVNTAELKSKSIKDTTFGGSLLNMGIDPAAPKLDESKLHEAKGEKDSTGLKQAEPNEKEPALLQLADPAALSISESNQSDAVAAAKESKTSSAAASDSAGGDAEKKDQKPASTKSEEKPADKAAKPDGER